MVVISDDLEHTKYSIFVFIQHVLHCLKAKFSTITSVMCLVMGQRHSLNRDFSFQAYTIGSKPMKSPSSGTFLQHLMERMLSMEPEGQSRGQCEEIFDVKKITLQLQRSMQHSLNSFAPILK